MNATAGAYFASPELYDAIYVDTMRGVSYIDAARAAGGPVLEVGCGNGHVLVPLREAGIDIDGLDLDAAMLADAARKLAARGLTTRLTRGDMRDFTLPRRYALVIIPFNTFLHNVTTADQLATLRGCRRHLVPGGALMFDVFSPDVHRLLDAGRERMAFEHPHPAGRGTLRVFDVATTDAVEQVRDFRRRVEVRDEDGGLIERHDLAFRLRYVWKNEMELLLRTAGFSRWRVEARHWAREDFARKERLEPGDMMLWTAWND
jgi:SAM-dependent methyltransferase